MGLQKQGMCYRFDGFVLDAQERLLELAGQEIHLRPKSLDTLIYLVERRGHLVSKEELLDSLWPDTEVTENALMQCVRDLREALGDDPKKPRFVQTVQRAGYRFIARVVEVQEEQRGAIGYEYEVEEITAVSLVVEEDDGRALTQPQLAAGKRSWHLGGALVALAAVAGAFCAWLWFSPRPPALAFEERDWVLITDFDNQTGDPVFDEALRVELERALSVSHYANFVPRGRVIDTLQFMERPAEERITEGVGREICLRDGGIRAMVSGSMQEIGGRYAISVKLIEPAEGATVAVFSDRAEGREKVLEAMHRLSEELRRKLGEPLEAMASPERHLQKVTTDSLEALTLYSRGLVSLNEFQWGKAEAFFDQAVKEDPEFALGYMIRGYTRTMLSRDASGDYARAAELSDRVTLRERLALQAFMASAAGDVPLAIDLWESIVEQYPDDYWAHENVSWLYLLTENYQPWVHHQADCRRLRPNFALPRFHAGWVHMVFAGDIEKAAAEFAPLLAADPDFPSVRVQSIQAFVHWDRGEMDLATKAMGKFREERMAVLPPSRQVLARRLMARFYLFNGLTDEALAMLETTRYMTSSIDPADLAKRFRLERALIYQETGRQEEFERVIREEAADSVGIHRVEALGWLGIALARQGRTEEARDLQVELEQEDRHPPYGFWSPLLPRQLERGREAFSLQIDGEILLWNGQAEEALERFDDVLAMVLPRNALFGTMLSPRVWLAAAQSSARAHEQEGNWEEAVTAYQTILTHRSLCMETNGASTIWFDALRSITPLWSTPDAPLKPPSITRSTSAIVPPPGSELSPTSSPFPQPISLANSRFSVPPRSSPRTAAEAESGSPTAGHLDSTDAPAMSGSWGYTRRAQSADGQPTVLDRVVTHGDISVPRVA